MTESSLVSERRSNTPLRAIFPAACEALRPFFDSNNQWGGQSQDHLAYQTLREHFPELTSQDAFITVSTVRRLLAQGMPLPAR
jgi:hypothetical protein